jgi:hypothetical protein
MVVRIGPRQILDMTCAMEPASGGRVISTNVDVLASPFQCHRPLIKLQDLQHERRVNVLDPKFQLNAARALSLVPYSYINAGPG